MSTAWMILLAMVAGPGGHHARPASDHARPAVEPAARTQVPVPSASRSLSVARKAWHRSGPRHWSMADLEEFDTEEVDETWIVDLDAIASIPVPCPGPVWSVSATRPTAIRVTSLPPLSYFPLRC